MPGIIAGKRSARKVDIVAGSAMLSVTIHPRQDWLLGIVTLAWDAMFVVILYQFWLRMPLSLRVFWIAILVVTSASLIHEFLGEEILEFDSQKLIVRKGVHGWERKREYFVEQCSSLEWNKGGKGGPFLGLSAGRWPMTFGKGLSEDTANEILTALQQALPDVAQKVCSSPGSKEHFVTLGLNKR
jgi:hypothetical protein